MPIIKTEITIPVTVTYNTDKDIRQGEDARFPGEPYVDEIESVEVNGLDIYGKIDEDITKELFDECGENLEELRNEKKRANR